MGKPQWFKFHLHGAKSCSSEWGKLLKKLLPLLCPKRCSETLPILDVKERLNKAKWSSCGRYGPCWPSWSRLWRCHPQNQKRRSLFQTWALGRTQLEGLFAVTCECASVNLCSCVLLVNIRLGFPRVLRYRKIYQCREVRLQWFLQSKYHKYPLRNRKDEIMQKV